MIMQSKLFKLCLGAAAALFLVSVTAGLSYAQDQDTNAGAEQILHPGLNVTLREAVASGLNSNPEYGVVAASRRATDEELNQGRALFYPSLDFRGDTGYEYTDSPSTRSLGKDSVSKHRSQASLTLTQMLFDGWSSLYEVARQKARVTSSAHRVRETSELVSLSIVEAYLEVLRQRQLLMISRQNVNDHLSILDQIEQGVKAGRSTQADLEQARARLSNARSTESSTRQSLRNAEAEYRQQVGEEAGELKLPVIPYDALEQDVDLEVEKTLAYSPTLDIFSSDIEVAYAEAQGTKSSFYPQVDLQLNATKTNDVSGVDGVDTGASALMVMNWNLYRGGADTARAREFIHRHQQAKEQRMKAARQVEKDVRQTWASMIAAGERARQFAAQVDANMEVVKAYKDQFNIDRRTLLDVLDSQNELFVSRSNAINSEFLEMFAVYRLLGLKGALLPTLDVPYPRESTVAAKDMWSEDARMKAR